eukprot:CAMPEP_0201661698 /NCGR_PEP_ID=MMETSP0494-20130426/3988_1 /ASSEMBLY_ACC=CAM_ASM_000839 /TAXON_ID=420259 /ORGANISM="Thalassiosira gravida, Strain GMp14c1" /LENGTH=324 /DNA_ID=CAMNT_0048139873 /DNA_START=18 /DNA_END=992 /DNA_ORIENTATION=+
MTMATMHRFIPSLLAFAAILASILPSTSSFSLPTNKLSQPLPTRASTTTTTRSPVSPLGSGAPSDTDSYADDNVVPPVVGSASERVEDCKRSLIEQCDDHEVGSGYSSGIENKIRELEQLGEDAGFGQASSLSGLMSGEWELIYASDDITRSSPFFWAFRRAFPDMSDQIFSITDAIPAPIKMVGPATQTFDIDSNARPVTGTLVSRVKVATLGGVATSMMTTRCSVLNADGLDGLRLKVETTKPEDSTILQKLGPLGEMLNESAPPFPSGEALEQVEPGSSEIVMRTTYCDEGLRVTKNEFRLGEDVFVWKRVKFGSGSTVSL